MALRQSILALRSGKADVIEFKATIDELSRLAAGRAEDEVLLQQLEARLPEIDSGMARRLLMECHFRDEWRQGECSRVLESLPSLMQDSEALEQMREYVTLLAPDSSKEPMELVQPWQRELMRQQQTLATLLKFCPEVSSDAICGVLVEFMDHAQARLQSQLALVHENLQAQEPKLAAMASPSKPAAPSTVLGLSAQDFVERLRGQHTAICTIQARARGRQRRAAYLRLQEERMVCAVRIQSFARRGAAFRELRARRHVRWLELRATLTRWHQARRLQRAWHWARKRRQWRAAWLNRERVNAAAADRAWRQALARTQCVGRQQDPTGFSQYSIYTESREVKERQKAEEAAAVVLQAFGRATTARRTARTHARAAVRLQAAARGWRARSRARWWRRALSRLHETRRAEARWHALRATGRALMPVQTRGVLVQLNVSKELARVQEEVMREKNDFEESFKKWAAKMEKLTLAKKLHADWIPQMNVGSGESYYFNVRTGESSEEHPNMRQVRATEKKQRALAEPKVAEILQQLRDYEQQLLQGQANQLSLYAEEAQVAWQAALPWGHCRATYATR